jgi:hypothetical protein
MILGQPQPPYHNGVSAHLAKPIRPLKDNRCSDCRLGDSSSTSAKYYLATCPHQYDFSPTRMSLLSRLYGKTGLIDYSEQI